MKRNGTNLKLPCIYNAANETVGEEKKEHKKWISLRTEELVEKRRKAKQTRDQTETEEAQNAYRALDNKVKNSVERD